MEDTYKEFGKMIRKYRKAKNYSTQKLAEKLNVSTGLVNNIENGKNDVFKLDLFIALIKELNIPSNEISKLLSYEPDSLEIKKNKNDFTISFNLNTDENNTLIQESLSTIVNSYFQLLKEFNYNKRLIELLTNSISQLIEIPNFMKNNNL